MKALHMVTFILLIIGGLNWLLVGIFKLDLFQLLHMQMADALPRAIYILVGISALVEIFTHKANCKACSSAPTMNKPAM